MKTKYPLLEDGEKVSIPRGYMWRFMCCDCGLVHDMYHTVQRNQITMEYWRNRRATGQIRRFHEFAFNQEASNA